VVLPAVGMEFRVLVQVLVQPLRSGLAVLLALGAAMGPALASVPVLAQASAPPIRQTTVRWPAELAPLEQELRGFGFRVLLALPPHRASYGLFVPSIRTLWVSPLAFELGIGRQTFLHEAVHAAQSCPTGKLTPIGWTFRLEPVVEREIERILTTNYHHGSRQLEREAFGLQGRPDASQRLITALQKRCRARSGAPERR
jgi:hypothetical protein